MDSKSAVETGKQDAVTPARFRKAKKLRAALSVIAGGKRAESPADNSSKASAGAAPKHSRKPKRTLTPGNLVKTVVNFAVSVPVLARALVKPQTSRALREKVVLSVTSINNCRYCAWGHTHWALAHGVSLEEVNQILGHETAELAAKDPAEAAAILFAQHYAEHRDQFDPEAIENLRQHYSAAQVKEILAYIHAITLGNLSGNTVDAFLGRFRSHGHTSIFFEGLVTAVAGPVAAAVIILSKFDRKVGMRKMRRR